MVVLIKVIFIRLHIFAAY